VPTSWFPAEPRALLETRTFGTLTAGGTLLLVSVNAMRGHRFATTLEGCMPSRRFRTSLADLERTTSCVAADPRENLCLVGVQSPRRASDQTLLGGGVGGQILLRPNWTRSSGVRSATPSTGDPDEFDAATGPDSFRGQGSNKKREYWFTGDEAGLADFVRDDVVVMNMVPLGFYSSDTQAGGNTTAPWFQVVKITRKGSCD
jgi:hypothetical protein